MIYLRCVVDVGPAHLDRLFDYAVDPDVDVGVGSRVRVRFNGRKRTAWVAEVTDTPSVEADKVKPVDAVDGDVRWFTEADLAVWRWVADRFAGTLSGAIAHALPNRIVRVEKEAATWPAPPTPTPADRPPCPTDVWRPLDASALLKACWEPSDRAFHLSPPLHQPLAPLLVDLVARTTAAGRGVLVLTPSPAPGPADDVVTAMGAAAVDLRRIDADADRYRAFLRIQRRDVTVVVGERGAALLPVPDLGLVIVVDEASPAWKERRNPRHHARDAALARGRLTDATVVLTSTLPSAPVWRHTVDGHITAIRADRATERAGAPRVEVIDRTTLSPKARRTRLTGPITERIGRTIIDGGRVIVLAAAKGAGSSLACADCRARHECRTCGAGVAPDASSDDGGGATRWRCQVCEEVSPARACLDCGSTDSFPLRAGAKRLAAELARNHPEAEVAHMEGFDQPGPAGTPAIAVMTRGSVVPAPDWLDGRRADLLVVADPDVLLGRPTVDAAEDALRLWLDGAALADHVMVQTGQPTHPAIQALVRTDPHGFWAGEAERRAPLGFPPAGSILRFTGLDAQVAAELRRDVPGQLLGPDPDGVGLVKTTDLRGTLSALQPLRRRWGRDDVRVRVEVDPVTT